MKRLTTESALSTIFAYFADPNYGNIPDDEIDRAVLFVATYVKVLRDKMFMCLTNRPFDKVKLTNKELYEAWCLRVAETVDMWCEDEGNDEICNRCSQK